MKRSLRSLALLAVVGMASCFASAAVQTVPAEHRPGVVAAVADSPPATAKKDISMIKPSNGRIVWFTPAPGSHVVQHDPEQPLAAQVCHVNDERSVSLVVTASDGTMHTQTSVQLLQDEDARPAGEHAGFAEWMPYQKGQAAKGEAESASTTT